MKYSSILDLNDAVQAIMVTYINKLGYKSLYNNQGIQEEEKTLSEANVNGPSQYKQCQMEGYSQECSDLEGEIHNWSHLVSCFLTSRQFILPFNLTSSAFYYLYIENRSDLEAGYN